MSYTGAANALAIGCLSSLPQSIFSGRRTFGRTLPGGFGFPRLSVGMDKGGGRAMMCLVAEQQDHAIGQPQEPGWRCSLDTLPIVITTLLVLLARGMPVGRPEHKQVRLCISLSSHTSVQTCS